MIIAPALDPELSFIVCDTGRIAMRHRQARDGQPTIMFLPGYGSDMAGIKARAIDDHCARRGLGCLRFDYSGTGLSPGAFADGTLDRWLDETVAVIDRLPPGNILLVGSSMGGWIALHAALRRPARIAALLGIAAAPDFTEWGFADADEKAVLLREGRLERLRPDGSVWLRTRDFWESGQKLRLLEAPIPLSIPIRLVHGADDTAVPSAIALRLFDRLESADLQLRLIKAAGHNLSDPDHIAVILSEIDELVVRIGEALPPTEVRPHL